MKKYIVNYTVCLHCSVEVEAEDKCEARTKGSYLIPDFDSGEWEPEEVDCDSVEEIK